VPLEGRLTLDVGSGTGAVAEAAETAGARVITADRSHHMVAFPSGRWPSVVADVVALPFRGGSFFAALAGFVVNHMPPAAALREMARVVTPGGVVLASTWTGGVPDPAKTAIDGVLARWGWVAPPWYLTMKAEIEPISGNPARLASAAAEAELVDVTATSRREDIGVGDPEIAVAYRLALPHIAPWVSQLEAGARSELRNDAIAALGPFLDGWRPSTILLSGRVV
jgi:SAM-dependent methyltransferase